jgi:hypothetical protein
MVEQLSSRFPVSGRAQRLVEAAIRHTLEFGTWRTLTEPYDLADTDAIELMIGLVDHALHGSFDGPDDEGSVSD